MAGLDWLMEAQPFFLIHVTGSPIHTWANDKKTCTDSPPLIRTHTITKMNNNINMHSTMTSIAGAMYGGDNRTRKRPQEICN
jgi:hypothetical protein